MDSKGKSNSNTVYYVIAAIVVVVIIAVLVMRKPAPIDTTPAAPTQPETAPADTTPATPAPTESPDINQETGEIDYGTRGILSDVKCENGKMSGIITNVQKEEMNMVPNQYDTDVRIQVNGIVSKWFVCDKEKLAPNEYTYCSDMLGPQMSNRLTNNDKNEIAVWFLSDQANRGTVTGISCSGVGAASE